MHATITLPSRKIALALAAIATVLAIQSITLRALQYWVGIHNSYWLYQYSELFNINREANITTWFSSALLLGVAALLLAITLRHRRAKAPYRAWAALTLIFAYISMDETGTIHEKLTPILQEQFNLTGHLYFGWILVGIAAVLVGSVVFLPFVWHLSRQSRKGFIIAGLLYVGGAVIVESISANIWYQAGGTSLRFSAVGTVEEWLEMLGVITLAYTLLEYIRTEIGAIQVAILGAGHAATAEVADLRKVGDAWDTTAAKGGISISGPEAE